MPAPLHSSLAGGLHLFVCNPLSPVGGRCAGTGASSKASFDQRQLRATGSWPSACKQLLLAIDAAAIAAERTVTADHPVARDQNANMIVAVCGADGANGLGMTDGRSDLGVAARFARGNFPKLAPDGLLEGRTRDVDRKVRRRKWLFDRAERALDQVLQRAVILDEWSPSGTAARAIRSLSSNVRRQIPLLVAAISIRPSGLSKSVQRIVAPLAAVAPCRWSHSKPFLRIAVKAARPRIAGLIDSVGHAPICLQRRFGPAIAQGRAHIRPATRQGRA